VADRVEQVSLAAPGAAVEEERVEGDLVGVASVRAALKATSFGLADHEIVEAVAGLERRGVEARSPPAAAGLRLGSWDLRKRRKSTGPSPPARIQRAAPTAAASAMQAPADPRSASEPNRP
jgi:hypothetical protein